MRAVLAVWRNMNTQCVFFLIDFIAYTDNVNYQLDDGSYRWGLAGPTASELSGIALPIWTLVVLVIVVSSAPQVRWSTRFTTRTLLITMTAAAIVLGRLGYNVRPLEPGFEELVEAGFMPANLEP